ncbi:SDR family NAD(P)-dependent oxidoreductase [Motilimonas pumila]|uniref:SDR family NAD(P)-dependent oxidoreductase n=1 Tax=Motilimonas pumila TaxID=2303987 RepID=A0A418YFV2_9GAMM|nr:SDR family NAD(P)-dependent oxidoreductase [Motilimonas pumila]RJG48134.1 SDR family NAD(P)-dependent oxidoreductase [Motilimonas pumila]
MKTIVITGATSGIGLALVKAYLSEGHQVFACGRNMASLDALAHTRLTPLSFDIGDKQAVLAACSQLPAIDIAILNAGSCEYIDDAKHFDSALFERVIHTNLIALGYCLEGLLPKLGKHSQLSLMGSSASYLPFSRAQAYGSSKAAVGYLARSLALDLKAHHIEVSVICPGFVKTPLTDKNDFAMPMLITSEEAAQYIYKGINKHKKEIHFPYKFTLLLKLLAMLPNWCWEKLAMRMST